MGVHAGPVSFFLELEGVGAGRPSRAEGGIPRVQEVDGVGMKRIQTFQVEPIVLHCGTGMSHTFYQWIQGTFTGDTVRRNGAIVFLDTHMKPTGRLEFYNALLVEVTLPTLDKSQKAAASLVVKIQPERVRSYKAELAKPSLGVYQSEKYKLWNSSDFGFEIHGLAGSEQVTAVRGIQMRLDTKLMFVGDERIPQAHPVKASFSHLVIELPERHGEGFLQWHLASLKPGGSPPKTGMIALRAPGASLAFFVIQLIGVGIYSLSKTKLSLLQVGLFCESMEFRAGGTAIR